MSGESRVGGGGGQVWGWERGWRKQEVEEREVEGGSTGFDPVSFI